MNNDQVSDMITRIRNAYLAGKKECLVEYCLLNKAVLNILKNESYIDSWDERKKVVRGKESKFSILNVKLIYKAGEPAIEKIKRISKPGRRFYVKAKHLDPVRSGFGMSIISTPKGVMTDKKARKEKLGGEILCQLW